ncbi:hypothetical protein L3X38_004108 [Prunus dulcis]|uniref:Uncharacterized protein n=1 Tax=Prunus dulcis TaxID=3755 RepID=A0AAD4ZN93_PRUDU|nr:hypothetical protein L3X38_004108 [Prunus dulcis]
MSLISSHALHPPLRVSIEARSLRVVIHYLPDSPILHSYLRSSTLQPPLDCFVAGVQNTDKQALSKPCV